MTGAQVGIGVGVGLETEIVKVSSALAPPLTTITWAVYVPATG